MDTPPPPTPAALVRPSDPSLLELPVASLIRRAPDLAEAKAWVRPAGVDFRLEGGPRLEDGQVRLSGWLENADPEPREVVLFPVGAGGFHLEPAPGAARRKPGPPLPPPVPPAPLALTLPGRSRVRLQTALALPDWEWIPGAAHELVWTLRFWTGPCPGGHLPAP